MTELIARQVHFYFDGGHVARSAARLFSLTAALSSFVALGLLAVK